MQPTCFGLVGRLLSPDTNKFVVMDLELNDFSSITNKIYLLYNTFSVVLTTDTQVFVHSKVKEIFKNLVVLLTVHLSIFISVINQLDAQCFCFTISLFHASTCFEHMCSSSGGQNCITQPLVSSHL